MPAEPQVSVSASARITTAAGVLAATIDEVPTGGGTGSYFTPGGVLEDKTHPVSSVWHVRLLSTDRSVPDQLREAGSYDEAVKIASAYAARLDERAAQARADIEG